MGIEIRWSDFWGTFKTMPPETQREAALALDGGESGSFEPWIESRSPETQVRILDNAPEALLKHLRDNGVLSAYAILKLNVPTSAKVVDMRTSIRSR